MRGSRKNTNAVITVATASTGCTYGALPAMNIILSRKPNALREAIAMMAIASDHGVRLVIRCMMQKQAIETYVDEMKARNDRASSNITIIF